MMNKDDKKNAVFTKKKDGDTLDLLIAIQNKDFNPRNLRRKERLRLVSFLRDEEGKSGYEIARFLGFCDKTIWNDIQLIKRNAAQLVSNISVERIGGSLIKQAEVLIGKAKKGLDYALAWKIHCDLIDKLQSLGFVYKSPDKLQHSGEIKGGAENKIYNLIITKDDKEINGLLSGRPLIQMEEPEKEMQEVKNDSSNARNNK